MTAKSKVTPRPAEDQPFGQGEEPAVKRRMAQYGVRLLGQHRQLDDFLAMVLSAVERGSLMAAQAVFAPFCDALNAHVDLEDHVFFPAVHGLEPGITSELVGLVEDHDAFRRDLGELADLLATGAVGEFSEAFDRFALAFSRHEEREEQLVAKLSG